MLRTRRIRLALLVFGVSMGAAVALASAALRGDPSAVVIDSPFADYRTAVRKHLNRSGMPTGVTATLAIWFAQLGSGAKFAAVRPLDLLADTPCPIMMIRGAEEDFITAEESRALDAAMRTPSAPAGCWPSDEETAVLFSRWNSPACQSSWM